MKQNLLIEITQINDKFIYFVVRFILYLICLSFFSNILLPCSLGQ